MSLAETVQMGPSYFDPWDKVPRGEVPRPVMAVGDINSTAKGSGARANGGKPDFSLVDLQALAGALARTRPDATTVLVLQHLGHFQAGHAPAHLHAASFVLGDTAWEACCRVLTYGTKKYAAWNWAKGMPWSVPLGCAVRHLLAMHRGEDTDPESGEPHAGHVMANLLMLMTFTRTYPEGNDLPPAGLLG